MSFIISPAEVAVALGETWTDADILQAQDVIELASGANLNDPDPTDRFSAADLRHLRLAVQWQAKYLRIHPEVLTDFRVEQASANGASVKYREGDDPLFSPLALRFVGKLSWRASTVKVETLRPTLPVECLRPDPWVLLSTGGRL